MAKVLICCKLPNGIILEHPANPSVTVEIAGLNKTTIINAPYASTYVEEDFWRAWMAVNKEFQAVKTGAIFEAKSDNEAKAKAQDAEETGLEPMKTDGKDKRAKGVKKAE